MRRGFLACVGFCAALPGFAWAGPPYVSDDAEPTDDGHYEIYLFNSGTNVRGDTGGQSGIDFNYGAAQDLQLTAVVPLDFDSAAGHATVAGLGNVELAAKYRFLHQADDGWDVAVFPRLFLPTMSSEVGDKRFSLLLPVWLEKDWDKWSTFGGGGCVLDNGRDTQNFCLMGWALARQVLPDLQIGAELVHQTAEMRGGRDSTSIGGGVKYDIDDHYHLLAYAGPGLQNAATTDRYSWYASVLFTF
ncbi:MAG TPA: transporter [Rhizomicrobium sp.]|jgi:hypothetical protein